MKDWRLIIFLMVLALSLFIIIHFLGERHLAAMVVYETKQAPASENLVSNKKGIENTTTGGLLENTQRAWKDNLVYIEIKDMKFIPREVTVPLDTKVVWINKDWSGYYGRVHMIASITKAFTSTRLLFNDTFTHRFTKSGDYKYIDPTYQSDKSGLLMTPGIIHVK